MIRSSVPLGLINASYAAQENLADLKSDDPAGYPAAKLITREGIAERKQFCGFRKEDEELLPELRDIVERHADSVVDRFYEKMLAQEALKHFLEEPEVVARLKRAQREYLLTLFGGEYGEDYALRRYQIGLMHDRIGLEPEWYLGTYGLYLDLLLPLIHERFADDLKRGVHASSALSKLLLLDMQIVLAAYYGMRQKKAVEHSERLAAVGELSASIAHEVRNPLAGMKGALQILRKELAVKPSNLEIVDEVLAQITRLEQLVKDLLDYARPNAVSLQRFDLHAMLDRIVRLYNNDIVSAGISVTRSYASATAEIVGDPKQLEQVFLNLLYNAIQSMDKSGSLTVTTRSVDGAIEICFIDSGKGISDLEMKRIFQPFFTTKHRGSGLGLPIVLKIAEAHGGHLEIESELGSGTTARLLIPQETVSA
jgi:signal transduction histidine kinase